jgi:hypothetical protein
MGEYVNSQQVHFDRSTVSCGVLCAHHLPKQTASKTLFAVLTALYHKANPRPSAFVLFSDVIHDDGTKSRGQQLASKIIELFGEKVLQPSAIEVNPRSGNSIQVWLWHLDHEVLRKYYQEELANRVEDDQ